MSIAYSKTQILQKEVFYIETIDKIQPEKLTHLKAIFCLRATDENVAKICAELEDPKFSHYHLCKAFLPVRLFLDHASGQAPKTGRS